MRIALPKFSKFRFNRNWLLLSFALVFGGGASWLSSSYLDRREEELRQAVAHRDDQDVAQVVVANADLPAGVAITSETVSIRNAPKEFVHSDALVPDQFAMVEGQQLAYPLEKGKPVLLSMLENGGIQQFSDTVSPGQRAMTIQVDEINSISGMLQPGDRIDLLAALNDGRGETVFPLLQNIQVLATGQALKNERGAGQEARETAYTTVTLRLSPQDAQRIVLAQQGGKIIAALRNPKDEEMAAMPRMRTADLFGGSVTNRPTRITGMPASPPDHIEFIVGGQSKGGVAAVERLPLASMDRFPSPLDQESSNKTQGVAPSASTPGIPTKP